jgi:hypothetical protein
MKQMFTFASTLLALAAACSAHPGHAGRPYGLFWKQPGQAQKQAVLEDQIWRYAFVSVYQWTGTR